MFVMFGSLPLRNNNESICKVSGMLALVFTMPPCLVQAWLPLNCLCLPFKANLGEKRTDEWIYGPCQLTSYRNSHWMLVSEVSGPKRILLFKTTVPRGNSHIIFCSKNRSCKKYCWVFCREGQSPWGPCWNIPLFLSLCCSMIHAI